MISSPRTSSDQQTMIIEFRDAVHKQIAHHRERLDILIKFVNYHRIISIISSFL